jgi:hypothetical protein
MRHLFLMLAFAAATLWSAPKSAQSRVEPGPLCASEGHAGGQADRSVQQDHRLKVFSGEKLAAIYFWRAFA